MNFWMTGSNYWMTVSAVIVGVSIFNLLEVLWKVLLK